MRQIVLGLVLIAPLLGGCVDESREGAVYVVDAPPADRIEIVGEAPSGEHVWVQGHWHNNGAAFVWIPGHWLRRPSVHAFWVPGHWRRMRHGWMWVSGHWG